MISSEITVAEYLLTRLKEIGVDHLFGVPGDFVLGFFNQVLKSNLQYVGTCNELNAAYAADGYARIRGIGAFSSTYGVGELSAINGVAGAFAERVPVVVITGSPATANFRTRPLLHHTLGDYQIPLRIYEKITAASTQLMSADTAPAEIDRVLSACLSHQQPVYISLPADVVMKKCHRPSAFLFPTPVPSDQDALGEAIKEAIGMLDVAQKPVVIADVELIRFKLQKTFASFLDKTGFPYVTMMLGKTVLSEHHLQFIGLFEGDRSRDYVRKRIESADCVLQLGALMTDLNTGGFTTHLDASKTHLCQHPFREDQTSQLRERISPRFYRRADGKAFTPRPENPRDSSCHRWLRTPTYGAVPAECADTAHHQAFLRPCEPFY